MTYEAIEVVPLTGAMGAEVRGVDLSEALSNQVKSEIHQAFLEHLVLFFPGQALDAKRMVTVSTHFGEPTFYPFIEGVPEEPRVIPLIKEAHERKNFGEGWHSDTTYTPRPPKATVLYSVDVPDVGGDTLFANMYLAYETLSPGMQRLLDDLSAVHAADVSYDRARMDACNARPDGMKFTRQEPAALAAVHPVVRTHPESGRRALYVNCAFTRCFDGMSEAESRPLLDYLYRHLARPEFSCRFRWRPGSLAIWDNRCTLHLAINDYDGQRRLLHRTTVAGERPRGVDSPAAGVT